MLFQLWCQGSCVLGCCAWLRDSADSDRRSDCGRLMLTLVQNRRSRNVSLWFLFFSCSNPGDSHWLQHVHSAAYLPHFLLLPSLYLYLNVLCGSKYRDWSQFWFVVLVAHRKLYPTQATSLTLPFYKKNPNPFCLSPIGPLWSHVLQWRQFHSAFFSLLYNQVLWHSLLALILCTFTWQVKMDVFLCNM